MTREDIQKEILDLEGNNWLLELATGTGKSKLALNKIKQLHANQETMLIVVPRNIHKNNWAEEIKKWWPNCPLKIVYTTYISFPKHANKWDFVIFDECHHLSTRCQETLPSFNITHSVLLSATVSREMKAILQKLFPNIQVYKKDLRDAIDNNILPDPKVYLWPLELDNKKASERIYVNKSIKKMPITCSWENRWKYIKQKSYPVIVTCTPEQFLKDLDSKIDYWKRRFMASNSTIAKNKWLRLCSERLIWLSDKKEPIVTQILNHLTKYRTLTFCNSIRQTEIFGKHCINSKNKESIKNLEDFNNGKINHITACNMLNEGMNLSNCQVGIYANLNSSEIIIKQRIGRLLRHENPYIVIPYYKGTREEELIQKMLENYQFVETINSVKSIRI